MFLKRLEIAGFKSFAERVGIDFVPGVTAVVGPNGSGKSNITDAIRWVLGEQSAKSLRGAKMEDVIFSGSDSRKPLNFAEVSLILDNTVGLFSLDYTEISVTRRVFRSGESAYLLNGQQCRLKDITDLFMDSGLGKEAFSIISQGRVDEILNSRSEDRRNIFDEAAGVLKYRKRKQKAEHKLFETSDNLDRVLDILKELDLRLEPLEQQANAAKTYAELSEEIRHIDIHLLNVDAFRYGEQMQQQVLQINEQINELEKHQAKEVEHEQQVVQIKASLEEKNQQLESLQQQLMNCIAEAEKWEGRKLLSAEKMKNASMQLERIDQTVAEYRAEHDRLIEKITETSAQIESLQAEYDEIRANIKETNAMLTRSVTETEAQIEALKSTYIEQLNEEATVRNELKHIAERMQGEQTSSKRIDAETATLQQQLATLKQSEKSMTIQYDEKQRILYDSIMKHQQSTERLHTAEASLKEKEQLLQTAYNKQHEMQGRLRMLQSLEADFSGFYSGVKEVLQARERGQLQGIEGAVAEILTVDRQYVKAVETALGGAMQHIVTTTDKDARQAIQYLKQKNKGRATFLPLNVIQPRTIPAATLRQIKEHPEFIGVLNQLVTAKDQYVSIVDNLAGTVIVAKTLAGASAIAKQLHYRYRIVTIDGDIVNAGGSLTGGATQQRASVFSRRAELDQLTKHVKDMAESIQRGEEVIRSIKLTVAKEMQTAEEWRIKAEADEEIVRTLESEKLELDLTIRTTTQQLEAIEIGRQGAASTSSQLLEQQQELETRHVQLKEQLQTIQAEIDSLERLTADWRTEEAALTSKLTTYRERGAMVREQLSYQQRTLADMQTAKEDVIGKIKALENEQRFVAKAEEEQLSSEAIEQKISDAQTTRQQVEEKLAADRQIRATLSETLREHETTLRQLREKIDALNESIQQQKLALSRLEMECETVTKRLFNVYGLKPDRQLNLTFDEEKERKRLVELEEQVSKIGPVNPNAVEEYEEVRERHAFLTTQRNDLLEAQETLENAMSEMDLEMMTRFKTTFEAVQMEFRRVFKEMFGGGNADLVLTNPDDLLHTGVDIVARPPGKKMQNLSLLSGGERALTAISLLFAIIEVRPVPFCILDEVEAALDEANVIRYSQYLKRCSSKTQFIVITHRKGTMEGADVLYGITMQESGVSKLISVKLSEIPEEAFIE